MSFESLSIHVLIPRTKTPADDADIFGNRPLVAGEESGEIHGRVEVPNASEVLLNRETQRVDYVVFLPPGVKLTGGDELYWQDEDVTLRLAGDAQAVYDGIGLHHYEIDAYSIAG